MKKLSHIVFLSLILLTGCRPGIADYWNKNSIDYSDVDSARERFVTFAELAATAQSDEACDAIDILFDKLVKDPVLFTTCFLLAGARRCIQRPWRES